jgi:hypothetical protein
MPRFLSAVVIAESQIQIILRYSRVHDKTNKKDEGKRKLLSTSLSRRRGRKIEFEDGLSFLFGISNAPLDVHSLSLSP